MKEHPIIMSPWKVNRILEWDWTKGDMQTRRVIVPQPFDWIQTVRSDEYTSGIWWFGRGGDVGREVNARSCPYGVPGDRLWTKESYWSFGGEIHYSEDVTSELLAKPHWQGGKHVSSRFMPKVYSRLTLEVVNVRVERVQDITEEDARAEGCPFSWDGKHYDPPTPQQDPWQGYGRSSFIMLWDSINAKRGFGWEKNPWVWVVTFKRM